VELVHALQEHRIVERLKERQYEGYLKEVERTEQNVLDEIAGGAHARGVRVLGVAAGGGS
jgi:flagellar biosynthesis chaperone FliJ